jgi:hypothetical protein
MQVLKRIIIVATILLLSVSAITLAEPGGEIIMSNLEAGGNGAAYGLVYLNGPANRTQAFACPRGSSGLIPNGITQCTRTYGSSIQTEWQAGDTLTASAAPSTSAEVPYELRTGDIYLCQVTFTGWSGPCQGLGTLNTARNLYQCSFVLPASGTIEISASFSGQDFNGNPCVPIANPAPAPTPAPGSTPTPRPTDQPGNKLLDALTKAADEFADNLKLRDIIRGTAKFLLPRNGDFTYDASVTVQAVDEGLSDQGISPRASHSKLGSQGKLASIKSKPLILKGRGTSDLNKDRKLRLTSTKKGVKVAKGRTALGVQVTVTSKHAEERLPKIVSYRVIN